MRPAVTADPQPQEQKPMDQYRINFTIERRAVGDDQFREFAWGGTKYCASLDEAVNEATTQLNGQEWAQPQEQKR